MRRGVAALALAAFALALAFVPAGRATAAASAASVAGTPAYGVGRVVNRNGHPEYDVDGKPFFMFGAAFFYDRLPASSWDASMRRIRELGFNTLDLYVPWNWHELADGDFDFEGRTNPRRNLREVLRLARAHGFYLIVRPGPVIRNEWRNGGYPQWLLERPDYGMPLRDVLEGRYPATATLQNAHSDDAAAAWMRNGTHMRYAARWLDRALHEFDPVADRVLAVALDDDQGAYIDNQTWPAPHLQAYLEWLHGNAQGVVGPRVPTFVNTYQMKVTASSHVWAMGNWYQSDAYAIAEHDRSQLEFSTGLLQTRPGQPLWTSEFQAGWLQQPQDVVPQGADPSNTILALGTMLQAGVRGVVDFPAQDSLAPAGYEAPFSNAFYAWDAALPYPGDASPGVAARYAPTRRFGTIVRDFGPQLAATHALYDASIAWLGSAFPPATMTNADFGALADRTLETQRACRTAGLACRVVDLRFASAADLARSKLLLLPRPSSGPLAGRPFAPDVARRLAALARAGLPVASLVHAPEVSAAVIGATFAHARSTPILAGGLDAAVAAANDGSEQGFVTVVNYGSAVAAHRASTVGIGRASYALPAFDVPARGVLVLPLGLPLRSADASFGRADRIVWSTCSLDAIGAAAPRGVAFRPGPDAPPCTARVTVAGATQTIEADASHPKILEPDGSVREGPAAAAEPALASGPPPSPACSFDRVPTIPLRLDVEIAVPDIDRHPAAAAAGGCAFARAIAFTDDVYQDGFPAVVMENDLVRIVVSPSAGGRAVVFQDLAHPASSAFDSVGALRDDVAPPPPLSTSDRIAKYTHQFPAGFFNRPYAARIEPSATDAVATFSYAAPDAFPGGATFTKTLTLRPHSRDLVVDESATFAEGTPADRHGISITSLAVGDPRDPASQRVLPEGSAYTAPLSAVAWNAPVPGFGIFDARTHEAVFVVTDGALQRQPQPAATPRTLVVTTGIARTGMTRTIFRYDFPPDLASAQTELMMLQKRFSDPRASPAR